MSSMFMVAAIIFMLGSLSATALVLIMLYSSSGALQARQATTGRSSIEAHVGSPTVEPQEASA